MPEVQKLSPFFVAGERTEWAGCLRGTENSTDKESHRSAMFAGVMLTMSKERGSRL